MDFNSKRDAIRFRTHDVANMAPPLAGYNLLLSDVALTAGLSREGGGWAKDSLEAFGALLGMPETIELGFVANRHIPVLHTHDRVGNRKDTVEYHPAWHELLGMSVAQGLHTSPWSEGKPGAHVARAAGLFMMVQIEAGVSCPTTTTFASIPVLRQQADLARVWEPMIQSRRYDPRFRPAVEKAGVLVGMAMTEKQGGTDIRANRSTAVPIDGGGPGREYLIVGHKWFFSIPMSDAFLVTAQAPGGLSCFFMPRFTPDGAVNGLRLQRLKDKLGNRANASSEVEFHDAWALLVGEEGRGVATIMEMVGLTRLDCVIGSAAQTRQAVAQALHHAGHRTAFQKLLVDLPLMTNVLADLAIESEASTALMMRLARSFDHPKDARESAWRRLMTPAIKFWTTKRTAGVCAEALEVLGGIGYVEESIMPRLYREAPLNAVWEGPGNVMCLDVLRALARTPDSRDAVLGELQEARGANRDLDRAMDALRLRLCESEPNELEARTLVEQLALTVAGALLVQHSPHDVADAFCASRLGSRWSASFGTLPKNTPTRDIVRRASPTSR